MKTLKNGCLSCFHQRVVEPSTFWKLLNKHVATKEPKMTKQKTTEPLEESNNSRSRHFMRHVGDLDEDVCFPFWKQFDRFLLSRTVSFRSSPFERTPTAELLDTRRLYTFEPAMNRTIKAQHYTATKDITSSSLENLVKLRNYATSK